ncbi:MAG: hypothetical protein JRI25_16215, partial [Deltaproteobacteria bacterium]|nr:hypothetical protein [Deltaproteobacteria bacterium]
MSAEQRSRLRVSFTSEGLGGREFSPLNLPGAPDVDLLQVDPDLVDHLHVDFELDLQAGCYPVPLTTRLVLPLDVQ